MVQLAGGFFGLLPTFGYRESTSSTVMYDSHSGFRVPWERQGIVDRPMSWRRCAVNKQSSTITTPRGSTIPPHGIVHWRYRSYTTVYRMISTIWLAPTGIIHGTTKSELFDRMHDREGNMENETTHMPRREKKNPPSSLLKAGLEKVWFRVRKERVGRVGRVGRKGHQGEIQSDHQNTDVGVRRKGAARIQQVTHLPKGLPTP